MKTVFMGTPDFAVPSLRMLIRAGYEVGYAVTQPDKPKGRKMIPTAPPVKLFSIENNIRVLQPQTIKDTEFLTIINDYAPDVVITCAYGKVLHADFLSIPKYGVINVHASLLPKYRGAAPIQFCIINGDDETGITTMQTNKGIDTGDILLQEKIVIDKNITAGELHDKLSVLGADVLIKTLTALKTNSLIPVKQIDSEATYAPMISKDTGCINWKDTAVNIYNLIRGVDPWPGAFTFIKGNRVKISKARPEFNENCDRTYSAGEIVKVIKEFITVSCGDGGCLNIYEVQPQGGKIMKVADFINGYRIFTGDSFTN